VALGQAAIRDSGDLDRMLRHIDMHWGIKTNGRAGVTRLAQLRALEPFYAGMQRAEHGDLHVDTFFDAANRIGELAWRKEHLIPLVAGSGRGHFNSDEQSLSPSSTERLRGISSTTANISASTTGSSVETMNFGGATSCSASLGNGRTCAAASRPSDCCARRSPSSGSAASSV